jgi:hypothetical protein
VTAPIPNTDQPTATRFASLSRSAAVAVLAAAVAAALGLAAAAWHGRGWPVGGIGVPDTDLFRRVVTRVHAGEGYYDVQADEFRDFPGAGSVFNWRLPTYAVVLGALPDPDWGRIVLLVAALGAVAAVVKTLFPVAGLAAATGMSLVLLGGAFGWAVYEPDAFLTTEPWCEVLLLLSLAAYGGGRPIAGAAAGLSALALRELALPYCLAGAAVAVWNRRRAEGLVWVVGLTVAAAGFVLHLGAVKQRRPEVNPAAVGQWVGAGGATPFVLEAASMNLFLRPLPPAIVGLLLPVAALGLIGRRDEPGVRLALSAAGYTALFAVARGGVYWGMLYTPLLLLGAFSAPSALRDLWSAARSRPRPGN